VYKRRTLTRDVELGGQRLRAGDKLTFWEMSANRDDAVFEYPFRFDIGRDPNPHLASGTACTTAWVRTSPGSRSA
jgi:cytochrome P450